MKEGPEKAQLIDLWDDGFYSVVKKAILDNDDPAARKAAEAAYTAPKKSPKYKTENQEFKAELAAIMKDVIKG